MNPIIRFLALLLAGISAALAQPHPNGPRNELRLEDATRDKGKVRTWRVEMLAFGHNNDGPVLFFTAQDEIPWRMDKSRHDGLWRWAINQPSRADATSAFLTRLPVDGEASARYLSATSNGRFLLVCYEGPPIFLGSRMKTKQGRYAPPFFEVLDIEANKIIQTLKPTDNLLGLRFAALSADGKAVAMVEKVHAKPGEDRPRSDGWTHRIGVWNVATGDRTNSLADLTGPLALAPDGKLMAARLWRDRNKLVLVDFKTGEVHVTLARPRDKPTDAQWSPTAFHYAPTGNYIAGENSSGWLVWDRHGKIVAGGEPTRRFGPLCFLPQADKDGKEWITWQEWAKLIGRDGDGDKVHPIMAASVDGKLIAAGEGRVIRVWNRKE